MPETVCPGVACRIATRFSVGADVQKIRRGRRRRPFGFAAGGAVVRICKQVVFYARDFVAFRTWLHAHRNAQVNAVASRAAAEGFS